MIHGILQFTLRIAFRCVLHRCESQEIRCQKLFFNYSLKMVRLIKTKFGVLTGSKILPETMKQFTQGVGLTSTLQSLNKPSLLSKEFNKIVNDPTAGSPTVTLLRLLLPLNDQV